MTKRRRKIFEARVLRGRQAHGQGVWGAVPPDTEKTFKIEHGKSLEILLLQTYASNFYRHIATYIFNIYARPSILCSSFYLKCF